jgi:hypothetical protein
MRFAIAIHTDADSWRVAPAGATSGDVAAKAEMQEWWRASGHQAEPLDDNGRRCRDRGRLCRPGPANSRHRALIISKITADT